MCSELFWKRPHIAEMMVLVQQLSFLLMLSAHKWTLTHKCNSCQILGLGFLFYGLSQKYLPATTNLGLSLQSNPQLVNLWVMWVFCFSLRHIKPLSGRKGPQWWLCAPVSIISPQHPLVLQCVLRSATHTGDHGVPQPLLLLKGSKPCIPLSRLSLYISLGSSALSKEPSWPRSLCFPSSCWMAFCCSPSPGGDIGCHFLLISWWLGCGNHPHRAYGVWESQRDVGSCRDNTK